MKSFTHPSNFRRSAPAKYIHRKLGNQGLAWAYQLMEVICAEGSDLRIGIPHDWEWLAEEIGCPLAELHPVLDVFSQADLIEIADDVIKMPTLMLSAHSAVASQQSRTPGGRFARTDQIEAEIAATDPKMLDQITKLKQIFYSKASDVPPVLNMKEILSRYTFDEIEADFEFHVKSKTATKRQLQEFIANIDIIHTVRLQKQAAEAEATKRRKAASPLTVR